MDYANLYTAWRARATGDTAAGGLFNAGTPLLLDWFSNQTAMDGQTMPYVIADVASATGLDTFTTDGIALFMYVKVYVTRNPPSGADALQVGSDIIKRIYGDSSGGSAPTYGFHRWKATLSGSWGSTQALWFSAVENHTAETYCWVQTYRVWLFK